MNADIHLEHRAGSSQGKHEGEPSLGLCDRLDRTRDNSQRQLPTDHDYAVPTREYQTDQSSLKLLRLLLALSSGKVKSSDNDKTTPMHSSRSISASDSAICRSPRATTIGYVRIADKRGGGYENCDFSMSRSLGQILK